MKKILVTGCFDLFHTGHLQFLMNASKYGDLYVGVCTDENYKFTKHKYPIYNEKERLTIIRNIKCVKDAMLNSGIGKMDFENCIQLFKPDILIVNDDGHPEEKEEICKKYGMEMIVLKRENYIEQLPVRSTSEIIEEIKKTFN